MPQSVHLAHPSRKLFFLIHGYTGSPTDFNELPDYLHRHLGANVSIPLLRGHGTRIQDLDELEFDHFFRQVDESFRVVQASYDEIYVGGVSFGAHLALLLAARYQVRGVFNVCLPHRLNFPFNLPFMPMLGWYRKYWRKKITDEEMQLRRQAFHYKEMHANGLRLVQRASRELRRSLPRLRCPILTIHSRHDPLGNYRGVSVLRKAPTSRHQIRIYSQGRHNLFFSNTRRDLYHEIGSFFAPESVPVERAHPKIAAVVPAYNEGANIARVLGVLTATPLLDEIIVVDDGSTDQTGAQAAKFPGVTLIRNERNQGKAQSMQRGVAATDAEILFFCDADLQGLAPNSVEEIVRPVAERRYDMYIGVRNNLMQKSVTLFALNSGERAVTRELWNRLPEPFKHRYRIEAGLNYIAGRSGRGYGWRQCDYFQTLKERKYGFWKGTALRWWMNADVGYAYLLAIMGRLFSTSTADPDAAPDRLA